MSNPTVWFVAAAISITTTHYFFFEAKQCFPLHLLWLHMSGALVLRITKAPWTTTKTNAAWASLEPHDLKAFLEPWRLLYVLGVIAALVCGYNAMLDLSTISTLSMLLTLEWEQKLVIDGPVQRGFTPYLVLRIAIFVGGILAIYLRDYRLSLSGVVWSMLSIGLTAIARFVDARARDDWHLGEGTNRDEALRTGCNFLVPLFGAPILLLVAIVSEHRPTDQLRPSAAPATFILNVFASAIALESSGHMFKRLGPLYDDAETTLLSFLDKAPLGRALVSIALTHTVAVSSNLIGSPFVFSACQYCGFLAASGALLTWQDIAQAAEVARSLKKELITGRATPESGLLLDVEQSDTTFSKDGPVTNRPASKALVAKLLLFAALLLGPPFILSSSFFPATSAIDSVRHSPGTAFRGDRALDLVIARYDEPAESIAAEINALAVLPSIAPLDMNIIVYSKAADADQQSFESNLARRLQHGLRLTVRASPNVGRETEVYLHHMTESWDDLADHTIFSQADVHDPWALRRRLEDYFVPETGFLSLSYVGNICPDCERCSDSSGWSERSEVLKSIYSRSNNGADCKDLVLTYRGQFVASAARIRSNEKQVYTDLREQLISAESDKHQASYLNQTWMYKHPDSLNAPAIGYTLERMWGVILQCSEPRIAHQCPSLVAGLLGNKMPIESCQCLDELKND